MRKKGFVCAITVFSLLCVAGYIFFVNPLIAKSLNLYDFDKGELSKKAGDIANKLLGDEAELSSKESMEANLDLLKNLQRSIGLSSASEIVSSKIPVLFYSVEFSRRKSHQIFGVENEETLMTLKMDSHGQIALLSYKDTAQGSGKPVSAEEAGRKIKKLVAALNIEPMSLRQVRPQDMEKDGWIETAMAEQDDKEKAGALAEQEFHFSEKIEGVPLASYKHLFKFTRNDSVYSRTLLFKKEVFTPSNVDIDYLVAILLWFVLGFLALVVLMMKIRRDEIDWVHFYRVSTFFGIISFIYFVYTTGSFAPIKILSLIFVSLLLGLFFGTSFVVAESQTRENHSEKLELLDALFACNFKVKELGLTICWSGIFGSLFFFMPLTAFLLYKLSEKTKAVIIVSDPVQTEVYLPLSLALKSLVVPLFFSFLVSTIIFGVFAPIVCQRFKGLGGKAAIAVIFALVSSTPLELEPLWLSMILLISAGFLLCHVWERFGFCGTMITIFIPLSMQRAFLLIMAKDMMLAMEGLSLAFFWAAVLILSFFLLWKGKELSTVKHYEPKYLKRIKEKERFERELEIAKNLQSRLLPQTPPFLEKFSISTLCEPANEVGGDYFDFLELDKERMLIFLGDVSGKGIRAAFYMTLAKGLLHGSFALVKDHRELLTLLNRRFGALSEEGVFLTLITLTLDSSSGDMNIASAGHNPPLLYKNGAVTKVPSRGLVIGPMPDDVLLKSLSEYDFKMEEGDVLLLYTDGVTEAMNPKFDEYGLERLIDVFENSVGLSSGEIVAAIRRSVLNFTRDAPLSDDLTILVIKANDGKS